MKIDVRRSKDRGFADHGWLRSYHSFSFANYLDTDFMGYRTLRVINEDYVAPGSGFPTHPHRDMEIFSYVVSGSIAHKDSLGHGRELKPGQIQLMSAGTGVTHSEFNPSTTEELHLLQIWIRPNQTGLKPDYTEWHPKPETEHLASALVISPTGENQSAVIHQDAYVYRLKLRAGTQLQHKLQPHRGVWIQVIHGEINILGHSLSDGDGMSIEQVATIEIVSQSPSEALLFDLK
jgi:redox-sensitive bicupin YhaK (pirin superfamily)